MASNHNIKNNSGILITVVMDSNREAHECPPGGNVVFTRANPFDQPTFHVFEDKAPNTQPNPDRFITATKVNFKEAVTASSKYVFNGTELKHPEN